MKARVAIQIAVSPKEWRSLTRAAAANKLPLATYVRQVALIAADKQLTAAVGRELRAVAGGE
jgi:hypothetical protein